MKGVERYPLTWPSNWPRLPAVKRQRADFSKSVSGGVSTRRAWNESTRQFEDKSYVKRRTLVLSAGDATERLDDQLQRLGAADAILSTNQRLRLDGRPRQDMGEPGDPGAAVYFRLKGQDRVLACDRWTRVADNIAALAAHIDAIRRIDRYGVGSLEQAFAGYVGLPAKGETWKTTLGFGTDDRPTKDEIDAAFRDRARTAHPDINGGSHDAMASLTQARAEGLAALKSHGR